MTSLPISISVFCLLEAAALCCAASSEQFINFQLLYKSDWSSHTDRKLVFRPALPVDFPSVSIVWNGLGVFSVGNRSVQHAFDGLAKLVKLDFKATSSSGKSRHQVRFTSQLLRSRQLNESVTSNDIAPYLMFESVQPQFTRRQKYKALVNGLDNMNVNVARVGHEFVATNDYAKSYTFDLNGLVTKDFIEPRVNGRRLSLLSQISSAHPLPEAGTSGCLINFVTTVSLLPFLNGQLRLLRFKTAEAAEVIAAWSVPGNRLPYMHSFSLTQRYAVIFAGPLYIDTRRMLKTAQPFKSLRWLPELAATIHLVELRTGLVKSLSVHDGRYLMHHVNAYEDNDKIVFYATAYSDTKFFAGLELSVLNNDRLRDQVPINSELRRYTIDLATGLVTSEVVPAPESLSHLVHLEMPVINEARRFKRACLAYGIVMKSDGVNLANISLARRNLCRDAGADGRPGSDAVWYRQHHYPCEPQFVAARRGDDDNIKEDDGYLVTLLLDGLRERTYAAVFDARSLRLLSRAWLPGPLPYRLHGKAFTWN